MGIFSSKDEAKGKDIKDAVIEESTEKASESSKDVQAKQAVKGLASAAVHSAESKAQGVIIAPIITEKTHGLSRTGKYVFRVAKTANKKSVSNLIAELYKVHVENVNIINIPKKKRTVKYDHGYQKPFKKAIVTLRKGEHITAFDIA